MLKNPKTKKVILASIALFIVIAFGIWIIIASGKDRSIVSNPHPLNVTNFPVYFEDRLASLAADEFGEPIYGFTPELLIAVFPGLHYEDFREVKTFDGRYEFSGKNLQFISDKTVKVSGGASTISTEGYETLLRNLSDRLRIEPTNTLSINLIIDSIDISDTIFAGLNESGSVAGVKIVPLEVIEDSRPGRVVIRALVGLKTGAEEYLFTLNEPIEKDGFSITLSRVEPTRNLNEAISPSEYLFYFEVKKPRKN